MGFFLIWLAGSATAVAVAWTGVSIVDDELVNPAPASQVAGSVPGTTTTDQTALSLRDSGDAAAPEASPSSSVTAASQSTAAPDEVPTPEPSPTTAPAPTPTTVTSTTATSRPTSTTVTSTTATSQPTSTTATSTTATSRPTSTAAAGQTITFNLVGGSTAISFSAAGAEVRWAAPNPGFAVEIEPEDWGVVVDFEADHHESRIEAWWSGGPKHRIIEDPD